MQKGLIAQNEYSAYFEEAYEKYPSVPQGLLEAVAYTNTRMKHLTNQESCQGLPQYYSIMGLVADGKGYFENSLQKVAERSPYTEEQIIESPRIAILAYAAAYSYEQRNKRLTTRNVAAHQGIVESLGEIPDDGSAHNRYARDQQFYCVLTEMQDPHVGMRMKSRQLFNFESIFGKENYKVLKAPEVKVEKDGVRSIDGDEFTVPGVRAANCTVSKSKADYKPAIWNPANKNNYGSRGGEEVEFITIHTIQGSYASAIAWFRNRNARVSAHYIIRAIDGQVTQMVCEDDKAFHVKTDNAKAIGIEHEGYIEDGAAWYTQEMYRSSARLVNDIAHRRKINTLQTYGGPPTNGVSVLGNTCWKVKGHQHFRGNNHIDPGPFWDWDLYYRMINETPKPTTFTSKKGDIYDSGGASRNHGDQERKTFLIKPKNAFTINLSFKSFELEGTKDKPYDYLDIYDGQDVNGKFLGRYTGEDLPPELIAKSGAVFMEFRSDCQVNKKGWHIEYSARSKNPDCPAPRDLIAKNIFPMGATLSWKSNNQADEYLVYLKRKLEKTWTLYRTSRNYVNVTGLSANGFYQWQAVAVCDGDSSAFIGANFITPNVHRGSKPQQYTIRLNRGRFNDSGGKIAGYGNNENYVYRIIPPDKGKVEMIFSSFDTEDELDQLVIYDGLTPQSKILGTYSGSSIPPTIRSSGNGLTLRFTSDKRSAGKGWLASWKSIGGNGNTGEPDPSPPIVDNGGNNNNTGNNSGTPPDSGNNGGSDNGNTGGNTGGPSTPPITDPDPPLTPSDPPVVIDNSNFDPKLSYHTAAPRTEPDLASSYSKSFTLKFNDKDRSGRGLANRFFTIAQQDGDAYRSHPESGFFNESFDAGLNEDWKSVAGSWSVKQGVLSQTDTKPSNTNLYTALRQTDRDVYVYSWKSKMSGDGNNLRHGLHFFANKPKNPDRGNSYFVWIRDGARDYVEIYKTVNDQFDRKIRKEIQLKSGQVYDYKVIYNPKKGRIEVYVNNKFTASWVDRYPLANGQYISLRSGNCIVSYDDIRVYKSRPSSVKVSVDEGSRSMLKGNGRFQVYSLIVDRNIRWSKEGDAVSQIGTIAAPPAQPDPTPPPTDPDPEPQPTEPEPDPEPAPTEPDPSDPPANTNEIAFKLPHGSSGQTFFLPVDNRLGEWRANEELGFLYEDFSAGRLTQDWTPAKGKWSQENGLLYQSDVGESNCNIYIPVNQKGNQSYLYHFRARFLTEGSNKRFGLHFMAEKGQFEGENGAADNRGDSYLIWFRHHKDKADKVEIYHSEKNIMPGPKRSALLPDQFEPLEWYDIKVLYDAQSGVITTYLENQEVLSWKYSKPAFDKGNFLSLRVGDSQVQFDNIRMYQLAPDTRINLSLGINGMIRGDSRSNTEARVLSINRGNSGKRPWTSLKEEDVKLK
ncbi:MAG: CUB domain-containing protein [Bacteroidia bacterium]|nr:CUB domain-containing protein [Bacteroidia bacterium]